MACNNILFLILTRNVFPAHLPLIPSNTEFSYRYTFLEKCSYQGIKLNDKDASTLL